MTATVTVLYFASLREAAGIADERVQSGAQDLRSLYA
ncbi:molybdopterin synthase sulfur carrier subunit, partial [Xanthomonas perforans]